MKDMWADHRGIKQKGRMGKRAKRRSASIDLSKAVASGRHKEIQKVLGDKLYTQLTKDSSISAAQSPDETAEKLVPSNPNQQGATLTAGQQQTANLSGGSAGGNVGISNINNTVNHLGGDTSMVVAQETPVKNPKMRNLT